MDKSTVNLTNLEKSPPVPPVNVQAPEAVAPKNVLEQTTGHRPDSQPGEPTLIRPIEASTKVIPATSTLQSPATTPIKVEGQTLADGPSLVDLTQKLETAGDDPNILKLANEANERVNELSAQSEI